MKRNYYLIVAITTVLLSSCIGQEKEWTVDDWKDHLMFVNPSGTQGSIPGFIPTSGNIRDLPVGTHMVFDISSKGEARGLELPMNQVLGLTYLGIEPLNGKECAALQVSMNMELEMLGESMILTGEGKQWIDEDGAPVKMEMRGSGNVSGMEIPIAINGVLTEETVYQGHDCWVFNITQEAEMMGISNRTEMTMYLDKESRAPVRMKMKMGDLEQDSGYIQPFFSIGPSTWELGPKETITTPLGTYECQVIHIMEEGKTVGTIWATKDMRTPLKYVYVSGDEESSLETTLVLTEYSSG